jgi:purine-binding chemotaxis protein CheW
MSESSQVVVFRLGEQRYALPVAAVERIVRAAEVTLLPNAPAIVFGAIDLQGRVIPVLNIRRRFQLPEREIGVTDQFVIARTSSRAVALVVDETLAVIDYDQSAVIDLSRVAPGLEQFQGVVKLEDGLVLIHDLEKFLSLDEARTLDEAIERAY